MHSKQSGLTLIEVLIALSIIAIALTAIIKATAENIRGNTHLQEKTIATWIALHVINQARLKLIQLPAMPETVKSLNQDWQWQGFSEKTPNPRIRELHVKVFKQPEHHFVTELTSYLYAS